MAIIYDPGKLLKKIAPRAKIKKMLSANLTVKKAALNFVDAVDFIDKKAVSKVALKVAKSYKSRVKDDPTLKGALAADPALLIQRVQNEVVQQVTGLIREKYKGEFYTWLPTEADEPDPEHQLNYGKKFQIGVGEQPGDRIGCLCAMEIHVNDKQLNLGD